MGQAKKKAGKRTQYTDAFKAKALETWNKARAAGRSPEEAAKIAGIQISMLYAWSRRARQKTAPTTLAGTPAKPAKPTQTNGHVTQRKQYRTPARDAVLDGAVERLQREVTTLREEKEILKKTIQIFARRST